MRPFYFATSAGAGPSRWKAQGPGVLAVVALHALLLAIALKSPWLAPGAAAAAHQVRETWFELTRSGPMGERAAGDTAQLTPRANGRTATAKTASADAGAPRETVHAEASNAGTDGAGHARPVDAALVPEPRSVPPAPGVPQPDARPRLSNGPSAGTVDAPAAAATTGTAASLPTPGNGQALAAPAAATPARPDGADRRPHVILLLTVNTGAATYSFPALSGDIVYRVERGDYPDIETAVAYHVIGQIRARFPVSVKWDSHFKHSIVKLSMLPEDEAATAAFLRQELFGRRD